MKDNLSDTDSLEIKASDANLAFESKIWHMRCSKQEKECQEYMADKYVSRLALEKMFNKALITIIVASLSNVSIFVIGLFFIFNSNQMAKTSLELIRKHLGLI